MTTSSRWRAIAALVASAASGFAGAGTFPPDVEIAIIPELHEKVKKADLQDLEVQVYSHPLPPYMLENGDRNNNVRGIGADNTIAILKAAGLKYSLKLVPDTRKFAYLESGEGHVIVTIVTPQYEPFLSRIGKAHKFCVPVPTVLYGRKSDFPLGPPTDLARWKGKTFSTFSGWNFSPNIEKQFKIADNKMKLEYLQLQTVPDTKTHHFENAKHMLRSGRAQFLLALGPIFQEPDFVSAVLEQAEGCTVVANKAPKSAELLEILSEAFEALVSKQLLGDPYAPQEKDPQVYYYLPTFSYYFK